VRRTLLATLLFAAVALAPHAAVACGGMVSSTGSAELSGFSALLSYDGATEHLVVSIGYLSGGDDQGKGLAWLMPLPAVPKVTKSETAGFDSALAATDPPIRGDFVPGIIPSVCGCGGGNRAVGGGPPVLGRTQVGPFEFVTLGGSSASDVATWMRDHGFVFVDRQQSTVQSYLNKGWVIEAARLSPDVPAEGSLTPIRLAFPTDEIVYPLAIAGADHPGPPVDMALFVVTPFRPTSATYPEKVVRPDGDGDFDTPGDRLELRYSAPLEPGTARAIGASLPVPVGTWLTRYQAKWSLATLSNDLVLQRSPSQSPVDYRSLLADYAHDRRWARVGQLLFGFSFPTFLVLLISGLVVLVVGASGGGFRRRVGEASP